jgi:hypothetical protein
MHGIDCASIFLCLVAGVLIDVQQAVKAMVDMSQLACSLSDFEVKPTSAMDGTKRNLAGHWQQLCGAGREVLGRGSVLMPGMRAWYNVVAAAPLSTISG